MTFFQQIVQAYFVPEKVLSAKIVPVNVQPEIPIPLYRTVLPSLRAPQPPNPPPVVLWLLPRPPLPLSPVQQPPLPWFQQPLNLVSFYDETLLSHADVFSDHHSASSVQIFSNVK